MICTVEDPYLRSFSRGQLSPFAERERESKLSLVEKLLLGGEANSDALLSMASQGRITGREIFDAGAILLERGGLGLGEAAKVLSATVPRRSLDETLVDSLYSASLPDNFPEELKERYAREKFDARTRDIIARSVHLLGQGCVSLFVYGDQKPSEENRKTGLAIIKALATIDDFNRDFLDWARAVSRIETTNGPTLPHVFPLILDSLGLGRNHDSGDSAYYEVRDQYKCENGRAKIRGVMRAALTNFATGDRYATLDSQTLPIVGDRFGKNPNWLELTVSKGVVMLGSVSRMKTLGIKPTWMAADIYSPDETWQMGNFYYKVSDVSNPWELVNYEKSDPDETRARVRDVLSANNYVGFVRGDFEHPAFPNRILNFWHARSNSTHPDVVRATGTAGISVGFMENLLNIVRPDGGLIIIGVSSGDGLDFPGNIVWEVRRDQSGVRVNLMHASEHTSN